MARGVGLLMVACIACGGEVTKVDAGADGGPWICVDHTERANPRCVESGDYEFVATFCAEIDAALGSHPCPDGYSSSCAYPSGTNYNYPPTNTDAAAAVCEAFDGGFTRY